MKKTFSRAFSLLLVLALLVSVIPSALADGVGDPEPDSGSDPTTPSIVVEASASPASIEVGETTRLSATVKNNGEVVQGARVTWSLTSGSEAVTYTDNATSATGAAAGTAVFKAAYTADGKTYEDTCSVSVTEDTTPPTTAVTMTVTASPDSPKMGDPVTLTATFKDASEQSVTVDGSKIHWSVNDADATLSDATGTSVTVTPKKAGSITVAVSCDEQGVASVNKTLTVGKQEVDAKLSASPTSLTVGQTATLSITNVPEAVKGKLAVSNWAAGTADVITLTPNADNTATATGKTAGKSTTISVDVTLVDDNYVLKGANNSNTAPLTSETITVSNAALTLTTSATSLKSGSSSTLTITPSIADKDLPSGASQSNITYSYDPAMVTTGNSVGVSVTKSSDGKTFTVSSPKGEGTVKITIKASYNDEVIASNTVTVGVYQEHTIYLTLKDNASNTFTFDEKVFSYYKKDDNVKSATSITVQSALTGNDAYENIKFDDLGSQGILTLSGTYTSYRSLASLKAMVQNGKTGTQKISYTWTGENGVKVAEGILYITVGETTGDIVYNTSYTEKVIFDASDFTKFWNAKVSSGAVSGTLDHITFEDMKTGVNPKYGQLYRDTSCSNKVNTSMEFTTSRTGYYLLDNVTYKPDSTITSPVTVQIPFTAYSTGTSTTRKSVDGVIVININQETTTITAYGVQFGNGTNSIADFIVDTFKANTGDTLSYVTFPSVSASTGKLLYDFSGVLDSREVLSTSKFYYNGAKTDLDLDDVVFVPRAGLYGEVTLYYKAYNTGATKEYSGTIVLNVQQKTKSAEFSDVTASSYSWAADSVDFLSYEGIAQGSNGKYKPASNITRGDFMLMLYRAFLEDEHKNDSITSNFSDVVKGSDTYSKETYQAVGVAKKLGIAQGTNGKFNPKSYITRQEAMTLIYRTLDEVNYDLEYTVSTSPSSFKDYSSVASYAKTAISDLIGHGIVIGNNSKINPTSNITRAEMAVILHRVLTY